METIITFIVDMCKHAFTQGGIEFGIFVIVLLSLLTFMLICGIYLLIIGGISKVRNKNASKRKSHSDDSDEDRLWSFGDSGYSDGGGSDE